MNRFQESFLYTLVSVFGSLLPFLLLYFLIYFSGYETPDITDIIGHGELSVVCITIGIAVIFSLVNTKTESGSFTGFALFFWITLVLVIFGICAYASRLKDVFLAGLENTITINVHSDPKELIGIERITVFSIVFLIWITIATFYSRYMERREVVSLTKPRNDDEKKLYDKVNP